MKKETIYLIVAFVLTIIILGGVYFYFFKKPLTIPQKPTITFPKITTTTITTTTTTSPKIMQSFTRRQLFLMKQP
jgi:flagellar basal body-associated protein FliL